MIHVCRNPRSGGFQFSGPRTKCLVFGSVERKFGIVSCASNFANVYSIADKDVLLALLKKSAIV